jgi:hypothetical protein
VGNSYDEDEDEVFVGEVPVEVAEMIRRGEEGEESVSCEDRVEVVGNSTRVDVAG